MQLVDLVLTGVPVAAAGGAGVTATVRQPGARLTSALQHFAAGVVIAAALELLPEVEYLFVGLSLAGSLGTGASRTLRLALPLLLSLLSVAGAFIGVWLLAGVSPVVLAGVLAFGAVAFMYLATEELLVEAHESGETALGSATFYVGFLAVLMIEQALR